MTQAVTLAQLGGADTTLPFRNRIINGAMVIDQRNAGATVTPTNASYTLDRWKFSVAQASKLTVGQSSTAPAGFSNSMLVTSSSAYSIVSSDYFVASQKVEGYNCADFGWGSANAKTVTLSFWVRSSLTGTFAVTILNGANDRSYPATYTINSANTWEQKSITIAGDTSGTWLTTNGIGLDIYWNLGTGSTYSGTANTWQAGAIYSATGAVSVVGTNGATWYVTGVQLETGTVATPFERRPYGMELALCQRYFQKYKNLNDTYQTSITQGTVYNSSTIYAVIAHQVNMRTVPTLKYTAASDFANYTNSTSYTASAITLGQEIGTMSSEVSMTVTSAPAGYSVFVRALAGSTKFLAFDAEL